MKLRVVTYNILNGGEGREDMILEVLQATNADIAILQEVYDAGFLNKLGQALNMQVFFGNGNKRRRVAILSRPPLLSCESRHPFPPIWRNTIFATIQCEPGKTIEIVGLHPVANLWVVCEIWRWWEAKYVLNEAKSENAYLCLIAGDLNAIAPGDRVVTSTMPAWLKFIIWSQGNQVHRFSMHEYLSTGYVDSFRLLHPNDDGFTLPASNPNSRLDYILVNNVLKSKLRECYVVRQPSAVLKASDHCPVVAEFEI